MLRSGPISTRWSPGLAYVIGLIASDGNLSKDGRHINLTSKDEDMLECAKEILGLGNKIGRKSRGGSKEKKYFVLQFGSIAFYKFLEGIGLMPAKSKTIGPLSIPELYFFHFLRGCIDGDGSITGFNHPESFQYQLRLSICSASNRYLVWLKDSIQRYSGITGGWIYTPPVKSTGMLQYGKHDSIALLKIVYKDKGMCFLNRKYRIAAPYLGE